MGRKLKVADTGTAGYKFWELYMLPLEKEDLLNWESLKSPMFVCFSVCFTVSKRKGTHCICSHVIRKICCFWAATEHCWSCISFPHCSHFPHGSWAPAESGIPGATSSSQRQCWASPSKARDKMCHWWHNTSALVPGVKLNLLSCSPTLSSPSYSGPKVLQFHGGHDPMWHSLTISAWLESRTAGRRDGEMEVPWG